MTTLVFGAEGMLGHKVALALGDVTGTVRGETPHPALADIPTMTMVDVRDWPNTQDRIDRVQPETIVNCAGMIKQRQPDPADAVAVNALFPHQLAAHCRDRGMRLIQISTDCVFDGVRGGYSEADTPNATDIYGASKALGELGVQALTLRTSLIGRELAGHRSLLDWYLAQDKPVPGFSKAYFSGVTTNWLAATIRKLIVERPDLVGLYNVASQRTSKYHLLTLAAGVYGKPYPVPDDSVSIDRSLNGAAFIDATGIWTPPWETMMSDMAADPTPYEEWR